MSDFLREVDEALKQDRMIELWNNYGSFLITAIVTIVLATAVYSGYEYWLRQQKIADTSMVMAALNNEAFPENIQPGALKTGSDISAIAYLTAAYQHEVLQNPEEAKNLYNYVANDTGIDLELRSIGKIALARMKNSTAEEESTEMLRSVTEQNQSPWQFLAHMHLAAINPENAQNSLDEVLNTPDLPPGIYEKVRAMKHVHQLRELRQSETQAVQE